MQGLGVGPGSEQDLPLPALEFLVRRFAAGNRNGDQIDTLIVTDLIQAVELVAAGTVFPLLEVERLDLNVGALVHEPDDPVAAEHVQRHFADALFRPPAPGPSLEGVVELVLVAGIDLGAPGGGLRFEKGLGQLTCLDLVEPAEHEVFRLQLDGGVGGTEVGPVDQAGDDA